MNDYHSNKRVSFTFHSSRVHIPEIGASRRVRSVSIKFRGQSFEAVVDEEHAIGVVAPNDIPYVAIPINNPSTLATCEAV